MIQEIEEFSIYGVSVKTDEELESDLNSSLIFPLWKKFHSIFGAPDEIYSVYYDYKNTHKLEYKICVGMKNPHEKGEKICKKVANTCFLKTLENLKSLPQNFGKISMNFLKIQVSKENLTQILNFIQQTRLKFISV
ncbi:GyrI-like domain-containing protein [Campylobacter jejuni]|uniref:GyrI-like domain-containing protein n=1 Tax=Campylobacter jejuni TaxID=197 RepID=UPI000BC069E7|nr:GyrI-like domain-containing protein [Campylobacter jejuni]ATD42004.1 Bacterial transcription activator, effector binding domain [Campylobacter jejuni]EHY0685223.1 GyrI-like domain-containing protein [Campylobacter jejuni]EIU4540240.1 GyrI-like domain-containing protein [Campylobacter jejuni]EIU4545624.1 GyrI-like domain-containing protein [Campylobacter jejuni]MCC3139478.1 GyrI-like domain-containing protein [Campylobacter jejuni]